MKRVYLAIDLKSFYASVECIERNLDPLTTNLVVADASRTEKTICLAVSPSLKSWGIPGRPRLFEVIQSVRKVNSSRQARLKGRRFSALSYENDRVLSNPNLGLDYIVATPRMALYMDYSTRIYKVYLKYLAPEDIHVYSIDEVFMDITAYLKTYKITARALATKILLEVLETTGITATAGIGSNLYLAKVAMDILAKHSPLDGGVQIAELDEKSYREKLWSHRPITDFWRVGKGYAKRLESLGIYTMGDVARCSLGGAQDPCKEESLFELLGVNAELLIDHAWGLEPTSIADIKAYKPKTKSLGSGQVLNRPYSYEKTSLVIREMAEHLALDLVEKGLVTKQLTLTVGYDIENLGRQKAYRGELTTDDYGRSLPKAAHGSFNLEDYSSSSRIIRDSSIKLFDRIINKNLLIRRINLTASQVVEEGSLKSGPKYEQLDFFTDYELREEEIKKEEEALKKERRRQRAILEIKKKYGKSSIIKAISLEEGATSLERNKTLGGHRK